MNVDDYKQVVNKFTTGVIVLTGYSGGKVFGMTINSFSSVSIKPLLVSFNIEKMSATHAMISSSNFFNANILSSMQESLVRKFAIKDENRFSGVNYQIDQNNVPIIKNNLANLRLKKNKVVSAGDHDIVICDVISGNVDTKHDPLIYFNSEILRK